MVRSQIDQGRVDVDDTIIRRVSRHNPPSANIVIDEKYTLQATVRIPGRDYKQITANGTLIIDKVNPKPISWWQKLKVAIEAYKIAAKVGGQDRYQADQANAEIDKHHANMDYDLSVDQQRVLKGYHSETVNTRRVQKGSLEIMSEDQPDIFPK